MRARAVFERIVGAAVRRPVPLVALVAAVAVGGGILALGLRTSADTSTLVGRGSETFKATERFHQRFGDDAVYVLVRGALPNLVLTRNIGILLGLEGCISGNAPPGVAPPGGPGGPCAALARDKPVRVVYGPGTFINEAVRQIQDQFGAQQQVEAAREQSATQAALKLAAAQGRTRADQQHLAAQARQLVRAEYLRNTLRLALAYGIRSIPRLNDPSFVSQLVFDPARGPTVPKARFAYLFPNANSALVQVRLRPDLTDAERNRTIGLIRAATRLKNFHLDRGERYVVTGAPVVVAGLTATISHSMRVLLVAALVVMALTLLAVFRMPPRRAQRLMPLAVALATTAILFGGMAVVGATLTMASIAVLPVLVGLAVDYAIQFQSRFHEAQGREGAAAAEAAVRAAGRGGPAIATACAATGAGFLVLLLSPVPIVQGFGLLLVIGIALAFACALTAGFAALTMSAGRRAAGARGGAFGAAARGAGELLGTAWAGALTLLGRGSRAWAAASRAGTGVAGAVSRVSRRLLAQSTARPARVLGIGLVLAIAGFAVDTQTKVVSDIERLVPADLPALRDLTALQRSTGVSGEIDVTVQANDLTDPAVLGWMRSYQADLLHHYGYTTKRGCGQAKLCPALSLPDLFRSADALRDRATVRGLLDAVPAYFSQAVITRDRRLATLAFGIRLLPLDQQQRVIDEMRRRLHPPPGVKAELVGLPVLAAEANTKISSHWRRLLTVLAALALVSLVLLAVYRRAERALVPIVPIALASGWSALVAFALRVPLNPLSVTLGALVIAISTEFSVLLTERYRQERAAGHDAEEALARTYRSTGAAVLASGATAIAGFAVLMLSSIRMLRDFGFVTVIDLIVSLLGVMIVLPAVLVLAERGELLSLPARAAQRMRALLPRPLAGRRRARQTA